MLLLLLAASIYLGFRAWQAASERDALESALRDTAGIHVTELTRDGRQFAVRGLRDPLAPSITTIAADLGIDADRLSTDVQPFQSLEADIVVRRAGRALQKPDGVQFEIVDGRLRVTGTAQAAWIRSLEQNYGSVAGIDTLDTSALVSDDPAPVDPRTQLLPLLRDLDGARFYFTAGAEFRDDSAAALEGWAERAANLDAQAGAAGLALSIVVSGSTDGSGNAALNAAIAEQRAMAVAEVLQASGLDVAATRRVPSAAEAGAVAPELRFVRVDLDLTPR